MENALETVLFQGDVCRGYEMLGPKFATSGVPQVSSRMDLTTLLAHI